VSGLRAAVAGRTGGTLRILSIGELDRFDPQRSYYMLAVETFRCMVRTLMTYPGRPGPDGFAVVPDLAEDYPEVSADRCSYRFRLREDAWFGPPVNRPVRSEDVRCGLSRLGELDAGGRSRVLLSDVAKVECPDPRTVEIQLARPLTDVLNLLALTSTAAIPVEVAAEHAGDVGEYVASGPYLVAEYRAGQWLRLARNPAWRPDSDPARAAWPDAIELRFNTPREQILAAIEQERADLPAIVNPDPDQVRRYATDPAYAGRWQVGPTNCARYITMNTQVPPFDDLRVRQAVAYAIDRAALRDVKGGAIAGQIAGCILPPTIRGHQPTDEYRTPTDRGDPVAARSLLAAAGYPDGLSTWVLVVDTGYGPAIGRVLRECLAAAGIDLEVRQEPLPRYLSVADDPAAAVPMLGSVGWCADWPDHGARTFLRPMFHSTSISSADTTNFARYANPDVDALIELAEVADPQSAPALWAEADRRIVADAACVPWLFDNHYDLISSRTRNYFMSPFLVGADWPNLWLDGPDPEGPL
jgi:peptide/nickel transport system substrate-binding protein